MSLIDEIKSLAPEDLATLARTLTPLISNEQLLQPRYFGDMTRVHVGEGVSLVNTLFNMASGHIRISNHCFFGHSVSLLTGTHDVTKQNQERQAGIPHEGRDIVIEEGVWIASGSIITGPCHIGSHAVIGCNSLVTGDIKSGWFYAGTPARPIRKLLFADSGRETEICHPAANVDAASTGGWERLAAPGYVPSLVKRVRFLLSGLHHRRIVTLAARWLG